MFVGASLLLPRGSALEQGRKSQRTIEVNRVAACPISTG